MSSTADVPSPDDLGPSQGPVLEVLLEADGELTTREITDQLERLSRDSVMRSLGRLKRRGLVESRPYNDNGWHKYRVARGGSE